MENNQFRRPLLQSAALLVVVMILATTAASSGAGTGGGGLLSLIVALGKSLLFIIGMAIGLSFCIALLIGVFLAAVSMVAPEQATQMYNDLKKNFSKSAAIITSIFSCYSSDARSFSNLEEYKMAIVENKRLRDSVAALDAKILQVQSDCALTQETIRKQSLEFAALKSHVAELQDGLARNEKVEADLELKMSEFTQNTFLEETDKLNIKTSTIEKTLDKLEGQLQHLLDQLAKTELGVDRSTAPTGLFAHIKAAKDQKLLLELLTSVFSKEMTYSQIQEYLEGQLPNHLKKIIQEHPTLTKNLIKDLKNNKVS